MEQEKSFKFELIGPPRLNNTRVSAVKPQTNTGDGHFQDFNKETEDYYNLPFGMRSKPKHIEAIDPVAQKVKPMLGIDQENVETMNELYSKLYKEAEKIKRWKLTVEYDVKEKERTLQENRKIIEALRKAIQELQFENEKLSLKLEDEIHANKDILKENNATRHLCSLLKEKFVQLMEKSNKYEQEREANVQTYVELNNNIERMIQAFEELRAQAENSRLEMYYKLKEAAENTAQLEKDYKREMKRMDKEVSVLIAQNNDKDDKMKEINIQLHDSGVLITELEEVRKEESCPSLKVDEQQGEMLNKAQTEQQNLFIEMEEMKTSLQKAEGACKSLETELQTAVKMLIQVTEQKEVIVEELKETRVSHSSAIDEFQTTILNLKILLEKEEKRHKELRDESDIFILKLQKNSTELEFMSKLKNDKEKQVEEMTITLENAVKVQKELEHQLESKRSENMLLVKEKETRNLDYSAVQVHVQELLDRKFLFEETIEKLQEREKELKDNLQIREEKIHDLEMKLSVAFENKQNCLDQLAALKTELEKERQINEQLRMDWNKVLLDKEHIATEKSNIELKVEKMKTVAAEAIAMQEEIDIRCQHKITEMIALMEKHKHQYDKTVEEKDTELEYYKTKEQDLSKAVGSLENELSCKKNEICSLQEQLKTEIEEKEKLAREAKKCDLSKKEKKDKKTQTSIVKTPNTGSLNSLSIDPQKNMSQHFKPVNVNKLEYKEKTSWTPTKTYTVKTPPKSKLQRESTDLLSEDRTTKKRKVLLELDTRSESSENNDLLSIVSDEEVFKTLHKDRPQASQLCMVTPKKIQTPSTLKTPASSVKLAAIRKMRESGWTAVSKMDRKKKMKEAGKLFT